MSSKKVHRVLQHPLAMGIEDKACVRVGKKYFGKHAYSENKRVGDKLGFSLNLFFVKIYNLKIEMSDSNIRRLQYQLAELKAEHQMVMAQAQNGAQNLADFEEAIGETMEELEVSTYKPRFHTVHFR